MNRTLLLIILISVANIVHGQLKIIDTLTAEPISGANIYSDQGILLGVSDMDGIIIRNSIKQIPSQQILIQHIAYENKELPFELFNQSENIFLTARKVQLEEITVRNRSLHDYVVLKGYFRIHDLFNNKSRYFYDGIIEYYIPLKNKKKKVQHKLLAYRLYANQESLDEYLEIFGKTFQEPPRLYSLKQGSYIDYLPKDCIIIDKENKKEIMRNGLNMGFVQITKSGNTQIYYDQVPPQSKISRSILKIKGERYRGVTLENYAGANLDNPSVENLINKSTSNIGAVQRKKKHGFIPMENFEEFYVIERKYMQAEEVKAIEKTFTKSIYLEEKSNYNERFWLDLDQYNIPSLARGIVNQFEKELKEK